MINQMTMQPVLPFISSKTRGPAYILLLRLLVERECRMAGILFLERFLIRLPPWVANGLASFIPPQRSVCRVVVVQNGEVDTEDTDLCDSSSPSLECVKGGKRMAVG